MQELIDAMRVTLWNNEALWFWLFFYFGVGFAIAAIVIAAIEFDTWVKNHDLSSAGKISLTAGFSTLSLVAFFSIGTIVRAVEIGKFDVPDISSLGLVLGVLIQVLAYWLRVRKNSARQLKEKSGTDHE